MKKHVSNSLSAAERISYALSRYKGITIETDLGRYIKIVEEIKSYRFSRLTDGGVAGKAAESRKAVRSGESMDALLPHFYALAAEAARRVLGLQVFDVQLVAAVVLHRGACAQVRTGEGKTLAAVFPAALNALSGKGVHVLTANDYLAGRDADWMGGVYRMLGLSVGSVQPEMPTERKKDAYSRDITYLTAKQAGFDFLKDSLRYSPTDRCMREFNYCIVDEADFIMIDEARNPMVIAGESDYRNIDPEKIDGFVSGLEEGRHFTVDRHVRNCFLTLEGQQTVEETLGCGGIHEEGSFPLYAAVNVSLHARHLLRKDVDYLVRNGNIELIDESTGRVAENRRWPSGIQTALEVKEGLWFGRKGRSADPSRYNTSSIFTPV